MKSTKKQQHCRKKAYKTQLMENILYFLLHIKRNLYYNGSYGETKT